MQDTLFHLGLAFQYCKFSGKQYKERMRLLTSSVIFYQTHEIHKNFDSGILVCVVVTFWM